MSRTVITDDDLDLDLPAEALGPAGPSTPASEGPPWRTVGIAAIALCIGLAAGHWAVPTSSPSADADARLGAATDTIDQLQRQVDHAQAETATAHRQLTAARKAGYHNGVRAEQRRAANQRAAASRAAAAQAAEARRAIPPPPAPPSSGSGPSEGGADDGGAGGGATPPKSSGATGGL
jgi:hypothetical protein